MQLYRQYRSNKFIIQHFNGGDLTVIPYHTTITDYTVEHINTGFYRITYNETIPETAYFTVTYTNIGDGDTERRVWIDHRGTSTNIYIVDIADYNIDMNGNLHINIEIL